MKKYVFVVIILLVILIAYAFVLPYLISAPSWKLVSIGVALIIVLPIVIYYLIKKGFKREK